MLEVYKKRLEAAAVMFDGLESDRINMGSWRGIPGNAEFEEEILAADTYEELHACGTPACFAGWVAVSPEFIEAGGTSNPHGGAPIFEDRYEDEAIQRYFGVDYILAAALCFTSGDKCTKAVYDIEDVEDITPAHIAKTLRRIRKDVDAVEKLLYD